MSGELAIYDAACRALAEALAAIERPTGVELSTGIEELFERDPEREWRDHIEESAEELSASSSAPAAE